MNLEYRRSTAWYLFFVSLFLCVWNLWNFEFLAIDTRFALFLREAAENPYGFFPTLYGKPYPDYTSLPVILQHWVYVLTGQHFSMFTTVFPTALMTALVIVMTYHLGRRMFSEFAGIAAALLLLCSYGFVIMGRIVTIDMYVAFSTVCSVYCVWTADADHKPWRMLLFIPLILFSFAARGPLGILIPAAVVPGYFLVTAQWGRMLGFGIGAAVKLGILFYGLSRAAYHTGGDKFLKSFLTMQIGDRLGNSQPVWYYLTDGLKMYSITFPLAVLAIVFIIRDAKKAILNLHSETWKAERTLLFWFFIILVGLSVPGTKHTRYLVPMLPAAALLAAGLFTGKIENKVTIWIRSFLQWAVLHKIFLSYAILLFFIAVSDFFFREHEIEKLIFPVFLLAAAVLLNRFRNESEGRIVLIGLASAALIVCSIRISIDEPVSEMLMASQKFVERAEENRPDGARIYFFALGPDGDENKYMVHVDRSRIFIPKYIVLHRGKEWTVSFQEPGEYGAAQPLESLCKLPEDTIILARSDRWRKLPNKVQRKFTVVETGNLGRRRCYLLKRKED